MKTFAGWILAGTLLVAVPVSAQSRDSVPREYKPPPGMCRIWLEDVPPNRQPEPTDCPTAIRKRPPNGRVIFGEEVRRGGARDEVSKQPNLPPGVRQLRPRERDKDTSKTREREPERKPPEAGSRVRRPPGLPPQESSRRPVPRPR